MVTTINKTFIVDNKIDDVWKLLTDPETVVTCVPGAILHEKVDDNTFKGGVQMKFGPVKAGYDGVVTFLERDAEKKIMKLKGTGTDTKGKGGAEMTMTGDLNEKDGKTEVNVSMEVSITGMLAQFGSRLIGDVSNQVFDQFIDNFKAKLVGGEVDTSLHTGSIVGSAIKGLFGGGK